MSSTGKRQSSGALDLAAERALSAHIEAALDAKGTDEAKAATRAKAIAQVEFVLDFAKTEAKLSDDELAGCRATLEALKDAP